MGIPKYEHFSRFGSSWSVESPSRTYRTGNSWNRIAETSIPTTPTPPPPPPHTVAHQLPIPTANLVQALSAVSQHSTPQRTRRRMTWVSLSNAAIKFDSLLPEAPPAGSDPKSRCWRRRGHATEGDGGLAVRLLSVSRTHTCSSTEKLLMFSIHPNPHF